MKKIILLAFTTILLVVVGTVSAANSKIGVFNLQTVLQNTPQLVSIQEKLRKQFSARNDETIADGRKLLADIAELRKMPITQTSARNALQVKIINEDSALRAKRTLLQRDLLVARNKSLVTMMAKIRAKASVVAQKKGFDIVFTNTNIAYSTNRIDITQDLIKALK